MSLNSQEKQTVRRKFTAAFFARSDDTHGSGHVINTLDGYTTAHGRVTVISASSAEIVETLPYGIAFSPDGRYLYVANDAPSGTVPVISVDTDTAIDTITAGNTPSCFW